MLCLDEKVFLISDDSEDKTLAQLVKLSSTVVQSPADAEPMVVIPCVNIDDWHITSETSNSFEPKRRKTISNDISQEYTILKTKCDSCSMFVRTSFEQVFHKHVHKNGTCLYCMELIVSGPDLMSHFIHCFLNQCHILDVLSCYMKKCSVRADTAIENSANFTPTQGSSTNCIIINFLRIFLS